MKKIVYISVFICLAACSSSNNEQKNAISVPLDHYKNINPRLAECIKAHGGLEQWKKFGTLKFQNGKIRNTLNLRNRNETFTNDSTFTVGYHDGQVWVQPDSTAYPNAKFYRNLYFYFFALPFVAADQGVHQEDLGQRVFNGVTYDLIKLSYGTDIGDSPDDQYILYINTQSNQLELINYSVTYFDKNRKENYNALVYRDWQEVNGLLVPTGFDGYIWENDTLGKKRYQTDFTNVSFLQETPEESLFQTPEGSFIFK